MRTLPPRRDYTDTMSTDLLRQIYAELAAKESPDEQDMARKQRIAQVIRSRGLEVTLRPMKTTKPEPKPRNAKHTPASHREKPQVSQGMTPAELEQARKQAVKFLRPTLNP